MPTAPKKTSGTVKQHNVQKSTRGARKSNIINKNKYSKTGGHGT